MTIQELIDSGSIKFYDFNTITDPIINWQEAPDGASGQAEFITALNQLYTSTKFRTEILDKLAPDSSLAIFIAPQDDVAAGLYLNNLPTGVLGALTVSVNFNGGFVNQNGAVESFTLPRILAHEAAHAVLNVSDTTGNLSAPNPDYKGDAVKFENAISEEINLGGERVSYSGAGSYDLVGAPLDGNVLIPTQWTFGNKIDTVLINKSNRVDASGNITATQPGNDINTESNTSGFRDLVIATDALGVGTNENVDNTFSTGKGDDYIYAGSGKDTINAGEDNDYVNAGSGDDNVIGGTGNDSLDGGADTDTLTYQNITTGVEINLHQVATSTTPAIFTATDIGNPNEWQDTFTNFEQLTLTAQDDIVKIQSKDLGDIKIDGAGHSSNGDTLDFSEIQNRGITVDLTKQGTGEAAVTIDGIPVDVDGFENVTGTSQNDTFFSNPDGKFAGGAGNDTLLFTPNDANGPAILWGGEGADTFEMDLRNPAGGTPAGILTVKVNNLTEDNFHLFSLDKLGLGNDFDWSQIDAVILNPDAADKVIQSNRDYNFTNQFGVEKHTITIPSGHDTRTENETSDTPRYDINQRYSSFEIDGWLGITPDTTTGVNVPVIAEFQANFLGGVVDTVYGAGANVFINYIQGSADSNFDLIPRTSNGDVVPFNWETNYDEALADFTDNATHYITNPLEPCDNTPGVEICYGDSYSNAYHFIDYLANPDGVPGGYHSQFIQPDPFDPDDQTTVRQGYDEISDVPVLEAIEALKGPWFIVGGQFNGTSLATNSSIEITLPDADGSSNFAGGSGAGDTINGTNVAFNGGTVTAGSNVVYGYGGNDTIASLGGDDNLYGGAGNDNLTGGTGNDISTGGTGADTFMIEVGDGEDTITDFTVGTDKIGLPAGTHTINVFDTAAGARVQIGTGTSVLLQGVTASQLTSDDFSLPVGSTVSLTNDVVDGTTGDDLVNTSYSDGDGSAVSNGDDVVNSGAGNDTISSGYGDDTIIYTSGNDWISAHRGSDTVDLSKYTSTDITFSLSGTDILIHTPDGVIELDRQASYDVGSINANVEQLIFSDVTLSDADLRVRALNDQTTSGDDNIVGTNYGDIINGSAGNDTINTGSGNDTIVYVSGNDKIVGSRGNDTLDLSKYAASDVRFYIVGHDIMIDTPDGIIELDRQTYFNIDSINFNIENILFSDDSLDGAGIKARALDDQHTDGDDIITGSYTGDLINGSAGNDTISTGYNDDTIIYSSGDDKIIAHRGFDKLDLGKYASTDVSFRNSGNDIFIDTPDGEIELDTQIAYAIGSVNSNIEEITFSDGTLDEAGIRGRALTDQTTAGNDTIYGTKFAETIDGGTGDDALFGYGGADTFVFADGSGDDSIKDFQDGVDMIQLNGMAWADVTLTASGAHTVITHTGDGSITLDYVNVASITEDDFMFV